MPGFGELFRKHKPFCFELGDALLIGLNQSRALRLDNAVHELFDFLFRALDMRLQGFAFGFRLSHEAVPDVAEHAPRKGHELLARRHAIQERQKVPFQLVAPDRLAIAGAAFLEAKIIRVLLAAFARGPAGGERMTAGAAGDRTTQNKISVYVGPRWRFGGFLQARMDALIGFKINQPLMLALAHGNAPRLMGDHPGIDRATHQAMHMLVSDFAPVVFRKCGLAFKIAFDFGLRLEAPEGETLQGFLNDGG